MERQPTHHPIIDLSEYRKRHEVRRDEMPDSEVAARVLTQWSHPIFSAHDILDKIARGSAHGELLQTRLTELLDRAIEDEVAVGENDRMSHAFRQLHATLEDPLQQQAVAHTELLYIKSQELGDLEASINRTMTVLKKIVHANDPPQPGLIT